MFKWLNKQGVESDKGFIVQCTEPGRLPNGRFCDIIESNAFIKWDDGAVIDEQKQKEILQNYIDAMEFQNMGVIVDYQVCEVNPNSLYAELQRQLARNPNVTGFEEIVLKKKD